MAEDLKAVAKRFYEEVLAQGKIDVIDEVVADDMVEHQEIPGIPPGKDGVRQFVEMIRTAFPDLKVETLGMVSEGDEVWVHARLSGTHQGAFGPVAATGKKASFELVDRVRVKGGQAVEHWGVSDDLGMLTQLGVVPEMA